MGFGTPRLLRSCRKAPSLAAHSRSHRFARSEKPHRPLPRGRKTAENRVVASVPEPAALQAALGAAAAPAEEPS